MPIGGSEGGEQSDESLGNALVSARDSRKGVEMSGTAKGNYAHA